MEFRFDVPCDWRFPESSRPRDVYWCSTCDFGQVWPRPQPEEIDGFYPDGYYTHSETSDGRDTRSWISRLRQHVAWRTSQEQADSPAYLNSFLSDSLPPSVCDLGCGNGLALAPFRQAGFEVVGVEPDEQARLVAATQLDELLSGTAEYAAAVLQGRQFSCVRLCHSLEHCLDPARAIEQAVALVAPGGVLMLETPNCAARGFAKQEGCWPWTDIPRHLNFFTEKSLRQACEIAELAVEDCDYRGFGRQMSDEWLAEEIKIDSILHPGRPAARARSRAWGTLLASVFSSRARKYDSVYVVARKLATHATC
jgi:SAM-dependent methyltransferase